MHTTVEHQLQIQYNHLNPKNWRVICENMDKKYLLIENIKSNSTRIIRKKSCRFHDRPCTTECRHHNTCTNNLALTVAQRCN